MEASIPTADFNASVLKQVAMTIGVTGALFVVLLVCLLALLRTRVTQPLRRLAESMRAYAADKSPAAAEEIRAQRWPNDEIGMLADSTAGMVDEITAHIGRISLLSTERERIRSELEIAGRIQSSALPEVEPPSPGATTSPSRPRCTPPKPWAATSTTSSWWMTGAWAWSWPTCPTKACRRRCS